MKKGFICYYLLVSQVNLTQIHTSGSLKEIYDPIPGISKPVLDSVPQSVRALFVEVFVFVTFILFINSLFISLFLFPIFPILAIFSGFFNWCRHQGVVMVVFCFHVVNLTRTFILGLRLLSILFMPINLRLLGIQVFVLILAITREIDIDCSLCATFFSYGQLAESFRLPSALEGLLQVLGADCEQKRRQECK